MSGSPWKAFWSSLSGHPPVAVGILDPRELLGPLHSAGLCAALPVPSGRGHALLGTAHRPDAVEEGGRREPLAQDPASGRQMGSSPQQTGSGSCALSHSASLPLGCGEPCLPGVGALGLGLPTSDLGAPGKARRRTLGQSPGQGRGWRAAGRRLSPRCHDACRPPNMRPKRLGTRFYFGRAFGPHLHVLFSFIVPSVEPGRAQMSPKQK